mmetsp:Transcript_555/g.967  ORF Transcript_555/g.967 Transcript_555/m.967 type:complete len:108 (+) Transcript_555:107-430(+)
MSHQTSHDIWPSKLSNKESSPSKFSTFNTSPSPLLIDSINSNRSFVNALKMGEIRTGIMYEPADLASMAAANASSSAMYSGYVGAPSVINTIKFLKSLSLSAAWNDS